MKLPAVLVPLRHRDFRLLLTGQTVSSFGNSISNVAVPFQLLALGASPLQLGITIAIQTASNVAFLLLGGAVADRIQRRTLILASDALAGCVLATVAALSLSGALRVEHLYVAAAGLGAAEAFLFPAFTGIIAELVPADILRAGNAARLLSRSGARILGPTIGGLVVAFVSPAAAFGIDALTFLFSFGTLLLAHPDKRTVAASTSIVADIREGFGYVFRYRWLWTTTIYFMLVNIAYAGQSGVMTPLLVRDTLAGDARIFGFVNSAYGVGTIVAGIGVAQLTMRRPGRVMFAFELLAALAVVAVGLAPTLPVLLVAMVVMGVALASSTVIWQSLLQRLVPAHVLGRVTSIDLLGNSVINPLAPLIAAGLIGRVGPPGTFLVAGIYALVLVTIAVIASPLRTMEDAAFTAA
ncbi:MAG TPA: MFS transporter [Candidatus Limnocylindria bacterium]|nr:MFS transporter [Candidatus Limnocylindria bacterium]